MARKIILFLSEYKESAETRRYRCPVGDDVVGAQTNEAPVSYLLRQYSDVNEIICIVTERAREKGWEAFQNKIREGNADVAVTEVPYEEGSDFAEGALTKIMEKVRDGDEVLLETTGGFRNAVMDMLLLSRVLSYVGSIQQLSEGGDRRSFASDRLLRSGRRYAGTDGLRKRKVAPRLLRRDR